MEVKEKKIGAEKDELFALLFPELLAAMNGEIRRTTRFRDCAHVFFANTGLLWVSILVSRLISCAQILRVMEERIWRAALALALIFCRLLISTGATTAESRRLSAGELILGSSDTCFPMDFPVAGALFQGVLEGDEIALQKAVSIAHSNRNQYVAVLFYASWCPFSRICLPNFNNMPSLFPTIPHFAFEESVIRPSILSRYGVHGFPTLFLLNSSMRVRYHGPRSINYFTAFYSDVTGVKPAPVDPTILNKSISFANLAEDIGRSKQENCPFSWARSPENLLQQDTYLALASSFVLLRLLFFILPRLSAHAKRAWGWHIQLSCLIGCAAIQKLFFNRRGKVSTG